MSAVVVNKLPKFQKSVHSVLNDALGEGARDGHIKAKTTAPFDKGPLRADSDHRMIIPLLWRISFWKEYARFQEFGGDSKRRVRNYSTSGTGKGFLKSAGDEQADKIVMKFKKHSVRVKV